MGERLSGRTVNWGKLAYLLVVFFGCTTIVLLPFFGLWGLVSILLWLVAIGAAVAAASCFLLAPCFVKAKKFDSPPKEVSRALEEMSKAAGRKNAPKLMLVDAPEVNAVAYYSVFGSRIAVTEGLVQSYRSGALGESDVKAVFAHEISHLSGRHPLKTTFAASWVIIVDYVSSGLIVAGSAFAALAAATRKSSYAIAAFASILFGVILKVLSKVASIVSFHYQRTIEYEADAGGAEVVGRKGMASMLQKIGKLNQTMRSPKKLFAPERWTTPTTNRSWLDRLFDTHPATEARVRKLLTESVPHEKPKPGQALPRMVESVCSGCGAKSPEGSGFCPFCGAKLRRRGEG
jgi:Zn-dependent protease with chaperone function